MEVNDGQWWCIRLSSEKEGEGGATRGGVLAGGSEVAGVRTEGAASSVTTRLTVEKSRAQRLGGRNTKRGDVLALEGPTV
jgi:hypothetical protein